MHFFLSIEFIIFHLILISSTISALSHHSSSDRHSSAIHHTATIHLPKIQPNHASILPIPLTPTFLPGPTRTDPAVVPTPPSQQSDQNPIVVVFEVIGGLLASGLLLALGRFCYQYRKAPKRDRIAEILNRHNLQRELEEIERNPQILRRLSLREPAPPYFPAPPSYEVTSSPILAGTNYTDMGTHNLLSSPQPSIPPRPAG